MTKTAELDPRFPLLSLQNAHSRSHAAIVRNSCRRIAAALLVPLLAIALACGESDSEGSGDDDDDESSVFFNLPTDRIYLAPGDSFVMPLFATSRLEDRNIDFDLGYVEPSPPGPPALPNDSTVRVDEDITEDKNELRVETAVTTDPGTYSIPIEASDGRSTEAATVEVVVVPTELSEQSEEIVEVAGGLGHSLALDENGDVWAWGRNDRGQLGDGTLIGRAIPVRVAGLPRPAVAIAAGQDHSLALLDDGTMAAWGENRVRQAQPFRNFVEDQNFLLAPEVVVDDSGDPLTGLEAIAAGDRHSVGLRSDGSVIAWGSNGRGALGNGSENDNYNEVDLVVVDAVAVAAGRDFTLALGDDGSVWGWGRAREGQIGADLGNDDRTRPIEIGFTPDVDAIGAGSRHSLLVLDDGNVGSLGSNLSGQLGDGSRSSPFAQPFRPPFLLNVAATAGGLSHSLALQADRAVYAWGSNVFGQVSDSGNRTRDPSGRIDQLVPVRVAGLPSSGGIAAGSRHSLSIGDFCGQPWAFGDDVHGTLGAGSVFPRGGHRPEPRPVIGLGEVGLPTGCPVSLSVVARGEGTISASGTLIQDADCNGAPCVASLTLDTVVDLSAVAAEGSEFVRWSGQCDSTSPTTSVVMDRGRNCLAQFNALPEARFEIEDEPVVLVFSSEETDLDGRSSTDSDGLVVLYQWDFGDDGSIDAEGDEVEFEANAVGEYPVRLFVTDDQGGMGSTLRTVTVVDRVDARILESPESVRVGETASFVAAESADFLLYEWDFENDGTFDATGPAVDHVFGEVGESVVRLRVERNDGATATDTVTVSVLPALGGNVTLTIVPRGEGAGTMINLDESFVCSFFGESSDPDPCSRTVPAGTTERLIPFPNVGSFFSHWETDACDTLTADEPAPHCIITLTEDTRIDLFFE